ncbi:hypothetical protein EV650_1613 [Kribbella kalugense]|uniref:Uncharacterized protein n=1 Tax=Kribbella kalugense TaxID=2512221 RepID=A0A4R7ZX99_9ACTN|nr:hypothetical protein EV650_1613 [Kribbella kalugense]
MSKSEVAARRNSGSAASELWVWVIPLKAGNFSRVTQPANG